MLAAHGTCRFIALNQTTLQVFLVLERNVAQQDFNVLLAYQIVTVEIESKGRIIMAMRIFSENEIYFTLRKI